MKKLILIGLLALSLVLVGCNKEACPVCEEDPLVTSFPLSWYLNADDESEILVDYWIYNYGYVEAKDVKVKCFIIDEDGTELSAAFHDIGNVASTSVLFQESVVSNPGLSAEKLYTATCMVSGCDGCEILDKRIPKLAENLE